MVKLLIHTTSNLLIVNSPCVVNWNTKNQGSNKKACWHPMIRLSISTRSAYSYLKSMLVIRLGILEMCGFSFCIQTLLIIPAHLSMSASYIIVALSLIM